MDNKFDLDGANGPNPGGRARPQSSAVHDIVVREAAPSLGPAQAAQHKNMFKSTAQARGPAISTSQRDQQNPRYDTNGGIDLG